MRNPLLRKGPSEVLGTPIVHDGLIYAVIGQDPEHGEGIGNLTCLDAKGQKVWEDFGGEMLPDETPRQCATRMLRKEAGLDADTLGIDWIPDQLAEP